MALAIGSRLGPYEILAPQGAGGMGEVCRARDSRPDRTVAIKVLPLHLSSNPEARQRFEREARAVSNLSHPHICTLHDIGSQDGVDFLVMEHLEGETLLARLEKGPLPLDDLLRIGVQIADALDKAHRHGVVHRDLKPGNVMLTKAGAKLLDFGLAKGAAAAGAAKELTASPTLTSPLTAAGTIVGTFQYMAPEQFEGKEADARSDIFALGAVLYEMATGRRAFEGKTQAPLIAAILKDEPRPIEEMSPATPSALDRLIRRCLAKDPEDRWQSARDLMHELRWIAGPAGREKAAAHSAGAAHPLPGTEGAEAPFWSHDSRFLGFFADGKLKKIDTSGTPPQILCDATESSGGAWSAEGVILFSGSSGTGLHRVPAAGGAPVPVTHLGPREESHRWPCFLPDGKHFVFLGDASRTEDHFLKIGSLDSEESVPLFNAVTQAAFARPNYLFYVRAGSLLAQPFDPAALRPAGEPAEIASQIVQDSDRHHFEFSVSDAGVLTFRSARLGTQLTWLDREGRKLETVGEGGRFDQLRLSPDGRLLAFAMLNVDGRVGDLWLRDLQRGMASRLTFHPGADTQPAWSPDGKEIVYASASQGPIQLYRKNLSRPGDDVLLFSTETGLLPTSWSPDGRSILFSVFSTETKFDVWILPVATPKKAEPLIQTRYNEESETFSPDGKWIAYTSDESGRSDVYVQAFPVASGRMQISSGGGDSPRWRGDGKEIFYVSETDRLMAAAFRETASGAEATSPKELFPLPGENFAVEPGGARFLVDVPTEDPRTAPITVVLSWPRLLKQP